MNKKYAIYLIATIVILLSQNLVFANENSEDINESILVPVTNQEKGYFSRNTYTKSATAVPQIPITSFDVNQEGEIIIYV